MFIWQIYYFLGLSKHFELFLSCYFSLEIEIERERYAILLSEVKPSSSSFVCDLDHSHRRHRKKVLWYCHSQDAFECQNLRRERAHINHKISIHNMDIDGQQFCAINCKTFSLVTHRNYDHHRMKLQKVFIFIIL